MNVLIVSGSHRKNSQSLRVAHVVREACLEPGGHPVRVHDLASLGLPFWDEGIWDGEAPWPAILKPVHDDMEWAEAFVIISPEWSGMATPMLKNYFLLPKGGHMANKPSLLVAVSSGQGGAYPIHELRSSSFKNTKICHIPEHVIVRNVESAFTGEDEKNDRRLLERLGFACDVLLHYAKALSEMRASNFDFLRFPHGM